MANGGDRGGSHSFVWSLLLQLTLRKAITNRRTSLATDKHAPWSTCRMTGAQTRGLRQRLMSPVLPQLPLHPNPSQAPSVLLPRVSPLMASHSLSPALAHPPSSLSPTPAAWSGANSPLPNTLSSPTPTHELASLLSSQTSAQSWHQATTEWSRKRVSFWAKQPWAPIPPPALSCSVTSGRLLPLSEP